MIQIDDTLISDDLFNKKFVCDLDKCKGECCVQGESGAPLEFEELDILEDIMDEVKPYMDPEGIKQIEKNGVFEIDNDGDYVTPLINQEQCAYVYFDEKKIAKCAIEKAYLEGKITWKKPISCHLYPIRIQKYKDYEAVNYHRWSICSDACSFGNKLNVPVYEFLKEPLIRKYSQEWYNQLEAALSVSSPPPV